MDGAKRAQTRIIKHWIYVDELFHSRFNATQIIFLLRWVALTFPTSCRLQSFVCSFSGRKIASAAASKRSESRGSCGFAKHVALLLLCAPYVDLITEAKWINFDLIYVSPDTGSSSSCRIVQRIIFHLIYELRRSRSLFAHFFFAILEVRTELMAIV
jgi:hypothetical protein